MRRWWVLPLAIFGASRVVESALFYLLLRKQHDTFMPAGGGWIGSWGHPVTLLEGLSNWDGAWYRQIAQHGYPHHLPMLHGHARQSALAFYPLFPETARAVMSLGVSFELAGFLISVVCGALASCVLFRLVSEHASPFTATMTVVGLMFAPMAPIFEATYAESMALLLLLLALAALGRRRYGWFAVFTLLISVTRPMSLPLALVCGVIWIVRWRCRNEEPFGVRERVALAAAGTWAAASFVIWPGIVGLRTGVIDAYFQTQNAWAEADGQHGYRSWIQQALHGQSLLAVGVVAGVGVLIAAMVLQRAARLWGLELRTWTWAYPLYILGTARPTTSIFRYLLLTITPLWPVPGVSERVRSVRARVGLVALVVALGLVGQGLWLSAYFVIWSGRQGAA